jgi:DNA-directed RNA polymerase subunit RPC12/RpoP
MCFAAITGRVPPGTGRGARGAHMVGDDQQREPSSCGYSCPHCGAPLAVGESISPHGDVKCAHCDCWFNIHGS